MLYALLIVGLGLIAVWLWRTNRHLQDRLLALESDQRSSITTLAHLTLLRDGLLQAIPESLLVLDHQKRILLMNEAAEKLFGQNLAGQTLTSVARHDNLDAFVTEGNSDVGDDRIEFKHRTLQVVVSRVATGEHPLTILLLIDETELHRLTRARREMVANISHELRTPIARVRLLADTLLVEGVLDKKRARKMIKDISRQAVELTQIVQEMRDLSMIESGQMPVRLTPSNLAEIIEASLEGLRSLAEDKQQTLTVETQPEIVVLADALQIQRVIKNLVHNAIKFTPEGGGIRVVTQTGAGEIIISVQDTGPGIPEDLQARIFERFFQGDFARTDGTGLGLAIARHIIMAHGERLWVESKVGAGATFAFSLTSTA